MKFPKFKNQPFFKQVFFYFMYQVILNGSMILYGIGFSSYKAFLPLPGYYFLFVLFTTVRLGLQIKDLLFKIVAIPIFIFINIYFFLLGALFSGQAI